MQNRAIKPTTKEADWLRELSKSGEFKDDLKQVGKGIYRSAVIEELPGILELLANDKPLPAAFRDHPLQGTYRNCRDLHVRGDLILIYRKKDPRRPRRGQEPKKPKLELVRIGTHSELFRR